MWLNVDNMLLIQAATKHQHTQIHQQPKHIDIAENKYTYNRQCKNLLCKQEMVKPQRHLHLQPFLPGAESATHKSHLS